MTPEKRIEMAIMLIKSSIEEETKFISEFPKGTEYYRGRKSGLKSALIFLESKDKLEAQVNEAISSSKDLVDGSQKLG